MFQKRGDGMEKQKLTNILLFIVGTELVGAVSAILAGGGFGAFYGSILQPPFAPPGWVFPVVWAVLYAAMGISAYLVWSGKSPCRRRALVLYGTQLLVNFLWSPVFFGLKAFGGAVVVVLLLLGLAGAMVCCFFKINQLAALLNIPYLVWLLYASYLTVGVWLLN